LQPTRKHISKGLLFSSTDVQTCDLTSIAYCHFLPKNGSLL